MEFYLRSCPFCGSIDITAEVSYLTKEFRIYCANPDEACPAEMSISFYDAGFGKGEIIDFEEMLAIIQQLVTKWNTRESEATQ